jgi:hypothetical protein
MEKKQTAVEYLVQQLFKIHNNTTDVKEMNSESIIEQAKQMEKEQIENAYWDGGQDVPMISKQCEQYYNETYGKTKN